MVVTVNEALRDLNIRHQIQLHRLSSGTAAQVNELLKAVEDDLVAQIAKYDPTTDGGYSKARLEKMLAAIRKINAGAYADVADFLNDHLVELAQYEADYQAAQFDKTLPFDWPLAQPSIEALSSLVTTEPFAGRLLDEWVSGLEAGQLDRITAALRIGLVEGETVDQLAKRLRGTKALQYKDGVLDIGKRQAENVVRTATSHVTNSAKQAVFQANDDLIEKVQWLSTLDTRTTLYCMLHDGLTYPLDSGPRPPAHYNCLPGDALVTARDGITGATKRWYDGYLVIIRTASGNQLSCTPNHPILTDAGWVPAHLVDKGDNVVSDGVKRRMETNTNPNKQHVPPSVEEIFCAALGSHQMRAVRMPLSSEDFHGDVLDGDVAIIASDRFLKCHGDAALDKDRAKILLVGRNVSLSKFSGLRRLVTMFVTLFSASHRFVSGLSKIFPLAFCDAFHSRTLLLRTVTAFDSFFPQDSSYHPAGRLESSANSARANPGSIQAQHGLNWKTQSTPVFWGCARRAKDAIDDFIGDFAFSGYGADGKSFVVHPLNGLGIERRGVAPERYTEAFEAPCYRRDADSEFFGDLGRRSASVVRVGEALDVKIEQRGVLRSEQHAGALESQGDDAVARAKLACEITSGAAGSIFTDEVVSVHVRKFSGHVFNLETPRGFYVANGIITHNCRSVIIPVIKSWQDIGIDAGEIEGSRSSVNGQVSSAIKYPEWLKKQPLHVVEDALGETKAQLFLNGDLKLSRFMDPTGQAYTISELRARDAAAFESAGL